MLTRKKHGKKTLSKSLIKRKQKRKPRRLLEATELDWATWDQMAERLGLNWSELTRRALNYYRTSWFVASKEAEDRR